MHIELLMNQFENRNYTVRSFAAFTIGKLAKVNSEIIIPFIPKLIELLDDGESAVRCSAIRAFEEIARVNPELVKPAIPKLIELLDDYASMVRATAAYALGNVGAKEALEPLRKLLSDTSEVYTSNEIGEIPKTTTVGKIAEEAIRKIKNYQ